MLRKLAERMKDAAARKQAAERLRELAREMMDKSTPQQRERWAEQWRRQNDGSQPPQDIPQELQDLAREAIEGMTPQERQRLAEQMRRDMPPDQSPDPDGEQGGEPRSDEPRESQPRSTGQQDEAPASGRDRKPGTRSAPPRPGSPDSLQSDATEDVDVRGDELGDQLIAKWLTSESPGEPGRTDQSPGAQRVRRAQEVAERAVNDAAVQRRYHKSVKRYFDRLNETIKRAGAPPPPPPPNAPTAKPHS
jgi:hypothetical protein